MNLPYKQKGKLSSWERKWNIAKTLGKIAAEAKILNYTYSYEEKTSRYANNAGAKSLTRKKNGAKDGEFQLQQCPILHREKRQSTSERRGSHSKRAFNKNS